MPASLKLKDDAIEVSLAGLGSSEFGDALERVRAIPGRRWDGNRKVWVLPAEASVAERLIMTIKPDLDEETEDWVRKSKLKEAADLTFPLPKDAALLVPWATRRAPWQPEVL